MNNPQHTGPAPAMRLIFEYEGDSVRLVSQQPVDTVVTDVAGPGDFVVETRDDSGQRLARVPAHGAFLQSAEVFPENHTDPITRVNVEARGAFTVIVPAPADATRVAVVHVAPPGREELREGATAPSAGAARDVDLATFPLRLQR
ncbi:hypothetical protein ACFVQ4_04605 [Streptomyces laurentii]|uniref:hypothetical protein n=1 Tax=Streptomyces laurentii TaxID=39478 RepID=UPI0036B7DFC5